MATREDAFFSENAEAFELLDKQYEAVNRIQSAIKQINEIQSYLKDGPDAINKLRMNVKYDQEQLSNNRKRIAELLSAYKEKEKPTPQ